MSKEYMCSKCNKSLSSKHNLERHEEKCNSLLSTQCDLCHKIFSSPKSKYHHKKNNICEKNGTIITNSQNTTTTTNINSHNNIHIEHFEPKIIIKPFCFDNNSYLYENPDFLRRCIFQDLTGILKLIKEKNFNDKHPENKNIKKEKNEYQFIRTFDGNNWNAELNDEVIDKLLKSITLIMDNQIQNDLEPSYEEDDDGVEKEVKPKLTGLKRDSYIRKIQNYLNLLKSVNIPIEEEYERNIEKKNFNKDNIYKIVEEFIKINSDSYILKDYENEIKRLKKENAELKKQLKNL